MPEGVMKAWLESSHFSGNNAEYIEELYESYLENAHSVSDEWRKVFDDLPKVDGVNTETNHSVVRAEFRQLAKENVKHVTVGSESDAKQVRVLQLINSYRFRGHQNANLDP